MIMLMHQHELDKHRQVHGKNETYKFKLDQMNESMNEMRERTHKLIYCNI